jgi:hypothetical protein
MYDASGRALWSSRTEGHPGASALMEKGGDFVISSKGDEIWSSRTEGHPGAWLAVQADANVVVYSAKGPLWASGSVDSDLTPGEYLNNSWYLESPNRLCTLNLQRDNNLVLYATNGLPLWYAGTRDATSATVVMQRDGNLVEYSASGKTLWASGTEGYSGASLSVTDYGEVVISWPKGTIWSR